MKTDTKYGIRRSNAMVEAEAKISGNRHEGGTSITLHFWADIDGSESRFRVDLTEAEALNLATRLTEAATRLAAMT